MSRDDGFIPGTGVTESGRYYFDIYFKDLTPEAQERFIKWCQSIEIPIHEIKKMDYLASTYEDLGGDDYRDDDCEGGDDEVGHWPN